MGSSYFPGITGGYGLPAELTRPDPTRRIPRLLLPFDRGISAAAGALGGAAEGIRSGLDYLGEPVPVEDEPPAPAAPAAATGSVPRFLARNDEEPDYLGSLKPPDFLRGQASAAGADLPEPPVPLDRQFQQHADDGEDYLEGDRGQVAITIGGKSYDYGGGERMPLLHRGGYGGGNLAETQPGGVVADREPSQISPAGLAEEQRRGGSGVSMMQELDGDTLPSELEEAREGAALSRLRAIGEDPYGLRRFEGEERIRAAAARQKGIEDRATQDATRSGYGGEMQAARDLYNNRSEHLERIKGTLPPERYEQLRGRIQSDFDYSRETVAAKYGMKLPKEDPLAALLAAGG